MEASILVSIKKALGIAKDNVDFDEDIMMHINTSIMGLTTVGVGPIAGFRIQDDKATWQEFVGDRIDLDGVKTYIYMKTRLVFDPPQNSFLIEAINKQIAELEWRLNVQADPAPPPAPIIPEGDDPIDG